MSAVLTKPPNQSIAIEDPEPYPRERFKELTAAYPDLWMEMTAQGEIVIMPPTLTETGRRNFKLAVRLGAWAE